MSTTGKIQDFENLIEALNTIVFGSDTSDVTLGGVTKPTISKFLKNFTKSWSGGRKGYHSLSEASSPVPPLGTVIEIFDGPASEKGVYLSNGTSIVKVEESVVTQIAEVAGEIESRINESKLSKETVPSDEILLMWADSMGNIILKLMRDGTLSSEDFRTSSGVSLKALKEEILELKSNSAITNAPITSATAALTDPSGRVLVYLGSDGDLYLPDSKRGIMESLERVGKSRKIGMDIALSVPLLGESAAMRLRNLNVKASGQKDIPRGRLRVSTHKDGGTTIQRIPVLFQVEANKALCMFNRGITGFDGDLRGVDTYQCFIEWNGDYEITNISTPTLMYSVQNELVGGAAKHATICRLENGDLYVMFDVRVINTTGAYYKQRYLKSSNNGLTWSAAQDVVYNNHFLTPTQQETISLVMGSCGQIITTPSGRLVTPMYTSTEPVRRVCMIYSDDQGQTWTISDNWIGGAFDIGGDGKSLGEPNIVQLNSGRILMYMKDMGTGSGYKVKAYSDDEGKTIVSTGYSQLRGIACEAAITKFSDDTLIATLPTALYWRTDFKAVFSFDEGETFNLIQHQELDPLDYGGYSSVIPIDDQVILVAVEGITASSLGSGESIDVYMITMKEVLQNGISNPI